MLVVDMIVDLVDKKDFLSFMDDDFGYNQIFITKKDVHKANSRFFKVIKKEYVSTINGRTGSGPNLNVLDRVRPSKIKQIHFLFVIVFYSKN